MSDSYHDSRFTEDPRRDVLWRALWRHFFRKRIAPDFTVLDLGCGYGNFINAVVARRRIGLDVWPGFSKHLAAGVEPILASVTDLSRIDDNSVDYAFASNVFEHISRDELAVVLAQLARKLTARGSLTILQPNYRYASAQYFDDYTHVTVWSHVSLADFLTAHGFQVEEIRPKFMPLSVKSGLPVSSFLIGLYLALPIRPLGKQMLLRARVR